MKTVFDITKVLTQGIIEREVLADEDTGDVIVKMLGGYNNKKYLHKGQWTEDLTVAKEFAVLEKIRKRRLLMGQIEKLEKMEIKVIMLKKEEL